jgi:hypothetical protein
LWLWVCLVNRREAIIVANVTSLVPHERLQAPLQNGDSFLELAHASQMVMFMLEIWNGTLQIWSAVCTGSFWSWGIPNFAVKNHGSAGAERKSYVNEFYSLQYYSKHVGLMGISYTLPTTDVWHKRILKRSYQKKRKIYWYLSKLLRI